MNNKSPEKMFAIKDSENKESDKTSENIKIDDDKNISENEKDSDNGNNAQSGEFSMESFKNQLKKDNISIDEKTINNYYNEISDNKKYINEYNTTIQNLESLKKDQESKIEDKGTSLGSNEISKQISAIEEKLANFNVEKRQKEDQIKSIINNIYEENTKTENIENASKVDNSNTINNRFESKTKLLNLTLNSGEKKLPDKGEESGSKKENNDFLEKGEDNNTPSAPESKSFLGEDNNTPSAPESKSFLGEDNNTPSAPESKSFFEKDEESDKTSFDSLRKEEETPETDKDKKTENSGSPMDGLFKKLSDDMSKGFESVLSAIGSVTKANREETEPKKEEVMQQSPKQATYDDKPKQRQQNYIDDYRKSLRSNAPLEGMVGIKGLELKVNNIGSYI